MTDWKALEDAEDHAYFMAELVEISPESFSLEEKRRILEDMWKTSFDIENRMREDFAKLDEVTRTELLEGAAPPPPPFTSAPDQPPVMRAFSAAHFASFT